MASSTALELRYLSEPDMVAAGVKDMAGCVDAMEEVLALLHDGDYRMGGADHNAHGIMVTFPDTSPFPNMPLNGPDRRFMAMPAYIGGSFDSVGVKWYARTRRTARSDCPARSTPSCSTTRPPARRSRS